jgi:hypothetical protein
VGHLLCSMRPHYMVLLCATLDLLQAEHSCNRAMLHMHAGSALLTAKSSRVPLQGELQVSLIEARALPVWGFPWTSNPWCRLTLGTQVRGPAVGMLQQYNPCACMCTFGRLCTVVSGWSACPHKIDGLQAENSRRDDDTSHAGRHRAPVWNQEFQFLVRRQKRLLSVPHMLFSQPMPLVLCQTVQKLANYCLCRWRTQRSRR